MGVECDIAPLTVGFQREYELYHIRNGMHLFKKELCKLKTVRVIKGWEKDGTTFARFMREKAS